MNLFKSSTGEGIALRIKSLLILVIPVLIGALNAFGIQVAPEGVVNWIDSLFIVMFGIIHAYAWFRSLKKK